MTAPLSRLMWRTRRHVPDIGGSGNCHTGPGDLPLPGEADDRLADVFVVAVHGQGLIQFHRLAAGDHAVETVPFRPVDLAGYRCRVESDLEHQLVDRVECAAPQFGRWEIVVVERYYVIQ